MKAISGRRMAKLAEESGTKAGRSVRLVSVCSLALQGVFRA